MPHGRVIVVGSDDVGDHFLNAILDQLPIECVTIRDTRNEVERGVGYARIAKRVAEEVRAGVAWRGILVCGTGIGVSIAANRVREVRAAVGHDLYSVRRSILSNNCQILCLGSRVLAVDYAMLLIREWLSVQFDATSGSAEKVAEIDC